MNRKELIEMAVIYHDQWKDNPDDGRFIEQMMADFAMKVNEENENETCKWEHNRDKPELSIMFCAGSKNLLWSDARHFTYCPFCGRKIERV